MCINDSTTVNVPVTANAGDTVTGNFQFANYSANAAANWTRSATIGSVDNYPASVTFTSLPTGVTAIYSNADGQVTFTGLPINLAAGQSFNFDFSYTAPSSGTVPVNTTVGATGDADSTNNTASGITTIITALVVTTDTGTTPVNTALNSSSPGAGQTVNAASILTNDTGTGISLVSVTGTLSLIHI